MPLDTIGRAPALGEDFSNWGGRCLSFLAPLRMRPDILSPDFLYRLCSYQAMKPRNHATPCLGGGTFFTPLTRGNLEGPFNSPNILYRNIQFFGRPAPGFLPVHF